MKMRLVLVACVLLAPSLHAPSLHAQERAATPAPAMAPEERIAAPMPDMVKGRVAIPELEISREKRLADEQARDIKQLKLQMAAYKQLLDNQQGQIGQLRTCLKLHDQILAGMPMVLPGAGKLGEHRIDKPLSEYVICKL